MSTTNIDEVKSKWGLRPQVKTTAIIGWFVAVVLFLITLEDAQQVNVLANFVWANPWVKFLAYMTITLTLVIFAIDKAGFADLFKNIVAQLYDPKMSAEAKVAYVLSQIEKMMGLAVVIKESAEAIAERKEIVENAKNIAKKFSESIPMVAPSAPKDPPAPVVPKPA
jgi:hypothetical protein